MQTRISQAYPDRVEVRGRDLTGDLMGRLTFTEYFHLLLTGEEPTEEQRFFLDLLLVSIAEHGMMPTNVAARMTLAADPGSLQGAVAAGILGAGPVVLGTSDECARLLESDGEPIAIARELHQAGRKVPGFGHPVHQEVDPRAERILELADERGVSGRHVARARALRDAVEEVWGKPLPMNVSMPIAAVLLDLGYPASAVKAVPILARTAGLLAHLAEEQEEPLGLLLAQRRKRRSSTSADAESYRAQLAYLLERSAFYREKLGPRPERPARGHRRAAADREGRAAPGRHAGEPVRRAPVRRAVRDRSHLLDQRDDRLAELHPADRERRRELADRLGAELRGVGSRAWAANRLDVQRGPVRRRRGAGSLRAHRAGAHPGRNRQHGAPDPRDRVPEARGRRAHAFLRRLPRGEPRPPSSSVERVLVAGEPGGGEPAFRAQLEEGWGAKVTEAMGVGDIGPSLWGECEEQDGMHLGAHGFVHPELIDPETREALPMEDGAAGELVLTHLRHRAAPLLRFRTRDHVEVRTTPCPCGRTGPRIRCIGRTDDMLIVRGVNVFPSAIREVVAEFAPQISGHILVRPESAGREAGAAAPRQRRARAGRER